MTNHAEKKERPANAGRRKIFVVDDHPMVRQGLIVLIDQAADLMVCGQAGDADKAFSGIRQTRPDLAIVDLLLGESNAIGLIERLHTVYPALPVLVLSMHSEYLWAERILRAGARGFVMKSEAAETLLDAVRKVLGDGIYLSENLKNRMLGKLVGQRQAASASPLDALTTRELQILQLIGHGNTTREIAYKISIGMKTVQTYDARIKEKLGLASMQELTAQAVHWVQSGAL